MDNINTDMNSAEPNKTDKKIAAKQDIYSVLREMILTFELYPGSRVTETELAEYFEVSRTPIREALLKLENEGHLTIRAKQGCFIRQIDVAELSEYYRVRTALELAAVEDACTHMPTTEVERLIAIWSPENKPETVTANQMEEWDESFHIAIALGGKNEVLVKYLQDINDHIRVIRRVDFDNSDRIKHTFDDHQKILQAILLRDVTTARNLIKRHIQRSEEFAKTLTLTQLARKKSSANRFGKLQNTTL
ncbi:GntR family transcriptional regulator [Sulfuriferula nivalis]|uniref:GntR family transcriptional regulator n=1 Tax=Sulfuriferula nivalis TaxID=2675298 RepID=A0A809RQ50_9PROT|nr:GntR family transcriptional regulator [Sulfuriferula nivalis]BBP00971.1 GntR family transcriptional regulator [Sulfuriferula nivalis]